MLSPPNTTAPEFIKLDPAKCQRKREEKYSSQREAAESAGLNLHSYRRGEAGEKITVASGIKMAHGLEDALTNLVLPEFQEVVKDLIWTLDLEDKVLNHYHQNENHVYQATSTKIYAKRLTDDDFVKLCESAEYEHRVDFLRWGGTNRDTNLIVTDSSQDPSDAQENAEHTGIAVSGELHGSTQAAIDERSTAYRLLQEHGGAGVIDMHPFWDNAGVTNAPENVIKILGGLNEIAPTLFKPNKSESVTDGSFKSLVSVIEPKYKTSYVRDLEEQGYYLFGALLKTWVRRSVTLPKGSGRLSSGIERKQLAWWARVAAPIFIVSRDGAHESQIEVKYDCLTQDCARYPEGIPF